MSINEPFVFTVSELTGHKNSPLQVKRGQPIVLELTSHPFTGYVWTVESSFGAPTTETRHEIIGRRRGLTGASLVTRYTWPSQLTAAAPEHITIRVIYERRDENDRQRRPTDRVFHLVVMQETQEATA